MESEKQTPAPVEQLHRLEQEASGEIAAATSLEELAGLKVKYLGRKGVLTAILRALVDLPQPERPLVGQLANRLKVKLEAEFGDKRKRLAEAAGAIPDKQPPLDVTLPGRRPHYGRLHPITQVIEEVCGIFISLGFQIARGPEVEWDYYNFEALNIPPDHPARDMHDTFYLTDRLLLRTHTSPVQIRVMEKLPPPIRVIAPGKVYRRDADLTHTPMFHQVEGLLVDEGVAFSDLKGVLEVFVHRLFGEGAALRFRPSFFPFTEPSAEVDIACVMCNGQGHGPKGIDSQGADSQGTQCRVCSGSGWLEILGAGMVDPAVFEMVGYDPERYTGFAFGMGIERIAMLKYGISDIRLFFENDARFLAQF